MARKSPKQNCLMTYFFILVAAFLLASMADAQSNIHTEIHTQIHAEIQKTSPKAGRHLLR